MYSSTPDLLAKSVSSLVEFHQMATVHSFPTPILQVWRKWTVEASRSAVKTSQSAAEARAQARRTP